MIGEALAHIKLISNFSTVPIRAERAMCKRLLSCVKMCKRVTTKDLLLNLFNCNNSTKDIEFCVKRLCKENDNFIRKKRITNMLMKEKIDDAQREVRKAKRIYLQNTDEYKLEIKHGGVTDESFKALLEKVTGKIWKDGKDKNQNKIRRIREQNYSNKREKYRKRMRRNENDEHMIPIKYKDEELEELNRNMTINEENHNLPKKYGGVELPEESLKLLSKNPKFMIYRDIDEMEMEVEIEKGVAKARYELMGRNEDSGDEGEEEEQNDGAKKRNHMRREQNKVLQYSNLRATDFPTVPRIMTPEHGTLKQEVVIERTKEKLLETVKEYKSKHCNQKGEIEYSNLSKAEKQQLKSLKKDIKDKNIVIFTTDKSGKFSVDTPKNYEKALMKHTMEDEELLEEDRVRKIENKMNQHLKQLSKMFKVGENNEHEYRIAGANTSTNTEAPPLYGLRKDHKVTENEQEGPPVRPVCGAKEAPNSRLSHFLSRIVNDYADSADIDTECRSSEEMRASFEAFNEETSEEVKLESKILSMDVKALYPSMEWEEIITAMKNMIQESDREIEDVDWHEVGKYLCVTIKEKKLKEEGLMNVIPTLGSLISSPVN